MWKLLILFFLLISAQVATAEVSIRMQLAVSEEPIGHLDLMVGTKLSLVVESNSTEYWYGGALLIEEQDTSRGVLYGRGFDGLEYPDSNLPSAGSFAAVWYTEFPAFGFELYGGTESEVGDWFIIDYNAISIGDCNVLFYDFDISTTVPVDIIDFHHVRTCDFNGNTVVDFADFVTLAFYWQEPDCSSRGNCGGSDLDLNNTVNSYDLAQFMIFWLDRTE